MPGPAGVITVRGDQLGARKIAYGHEPQAEARHVHEVDGRPSVSSAGCAGDEDDGCTDPPIKRPSAETLASDVEVAIVAVLRENLDVFA